MRTFIVSIPQMATCEERDVKSRIVEENLKILNGEEFPATAFVSVRDLIGNPDDALSCEVCDVLHVRGLLSREVLVTEDGALIRLKDENGQYGDPLCHYAWTSNGEFADLTEEELANLAWDLRYNRNFAHVCVVDDTPEKVLDESEEEEYDSSTDDAADAESTVETAGNEEHHE